MVKSYLRYELKETFGVVVSPTANVLFDGSARLALAPALEHIAVWNLKQGVLVHMLNGDKAEVTRMVASPDNERIAVGYADGRICIWHVAKREIALTLNGHRGAVTALRYNDSGSLLVSGSADTDIIVWDPISETGQYRLRGHTKPITDVRFLDKGQHHHIISSSKDHLIKIWDCSTQHCCQTLVHHKSEVWAIDVNASETRLVTGAGDRHIGVWQLRGGLGDDDTTSTAVATDAPPPLELKGKGKGAAAAAASSSETKKVTGKRSRDDDTEYDPSADPDHIATLWGQIDRDSRKRVAYLRFNSRGTLLACQAADAVIDLYRIRSHDEVKKKVQRRIKRIREKRSKAAKKDDTKSDSKESKRVVSSSSRTGEVDDDDDDTTGVSKVDEAEEILAAEATESDSVVPKTDEEKKAEAIADAAAAAAAEAAIVAIASDEFEAMLPLRTKSKISSFSFAPSTSGVPTLTTLGTSGSRVAASVPRLRSDTDRILVGCHDNTLFVYDIQLNTEDKDKTYSQAHSLDLPGHRAGLRSATLSADDALIMTTSEGQIKIWNVSTKNCIRTMQTGYALCGVFVPGGRHVVVGLKSGELEVWELGSGALLQKIQAHDGEIWAMDLRANGRGLATGGGDKQLKCWDFELLVPKEVRMIGGVAAPSVKRLSLVHTRTLKLTEVVMSLKHSPDGKYLAAGLLDSTVKVFFEDSLKFFLSLYGHKLPVLSMDISSDSSLLLTGSSDKNVKIWGLDFGDCHKSLFAHDDAVTSVRWVPRTHYFFTAGKDKMIKYWDGDKFQHIMSLPGHQAEIRGMCISSIGDFVVTAGQDRSVRIWQQTDEQLFLEEEADRRIEDAADKVAITEAKRIGAMEGSGQVGEHDSAAVTGKPTDMGLKSGERLMEAIDIAIREQERREEHRLAVLAHEQPDDDEKKGGLQKLVEELTGANTKEKKKAPTLPVNPFLVGKTPDDHVLKALTSIRTTELDESLMILPFEYVAKLMRFLDSFIERAIETELCVKCLLSLVATHQNQIVSNQVMVDGLTSLRKNTRRRLRLLKDQMGFNLAAARFMQQSLESSSTTFFFGPPKPREAVKGKSQKKKLRAGATTKATDAPIAAATSKKA